jgi:hypothetical protein
MILDLGANGKKRISIDPTMVEIIKGDPVCCERVLQERAAFHKSIVSIPFGKFFSSRPFSSSSFFPLRRRGIHASGGGRTVAVEGRKDG